MKKVAFIAVLVVLFTLLTFTFIGCADTRQPVEIDAENLSVWMDNEYYIGTKTYTTGVNTDNKFDLSKVFGTDVDLNLYATTAATLSGSVITVNETGTAKLDITDADNNKVTKKITFVDGVNAYTYEEFVYAVVSKKAVVVHGDFEMIPARDIENPVIEVPEHGYLDIQASIYGNGHVFDAYKIAGYGDDLPGSSVLFCGKSDDIVLQDFKITGRVLEEDETLDLTSLERYGVLISVDGDNSFRPKVTMKNLIVENSHKNVYFNNCDVTMQGCIVQNASDSTISIETNNEQGATIVMRNNVIANSMTAGIVLWGWTDTGDYKTQDKFVDLTIEGFLDIYNWKDSKNAKLMPNTEDLAKTVNDLVESEMDKPKYDSFFYKYKDQKWVQTGMIILATGGLKENKAEFHGLENIGFEIREFPLPSAAKLFCKTCKVVGYGTDKNKVGVQPDAKMSDNVYLMSELRYGRK
ncbi:MAG: right-handed parallel beta-helix repeat-containing protein [Christensenellales bacterium]